MPDVRPRSGVRCAGPARRSEDLLQPPTKRWAEKVGESMYLKLRWARFFTLTGWNWTLAPQHTMADFIVTIPCGHSECKGSHKVAVRVCESKLDVLVIRHRDLYDVERMYSEPNPALFGDGPRNTYWEMAHGAGGGVESVGQWLGNADELWERAARE